MILKTSVNFKLDNYYVRFNIMRQGKNNNPSQANHMFFLIMKKIPVFCFLLIIKI